MKKNIRWGILGCGNIAQKFASDLQYVQKATVYAVASKNEEKGKLFSEKFPLNKSLKVLKIMDKIRKKVGVVYPNDK